MADVVIANGQPVVDYMARDYDSFLKTMRALIPAKLPEWRDFEAETDFGNVLLELFAHMGDILSYYQDRVANESFLGTAQTRRSVIQHLRLIGYRLSTAAPAAASLVLSVPAAVNDVLTIDRGDAFATRSQKNKPSVRFEYNGALPLTINCATLPVDAATGRKLFSPILVEEGRLINNEVLGTSDGSANQRFELSQSRLILRALGAAQQVNRDITVITRLGAVVEEWTLQESLAFSRDNRSDYTIEIDEDDRTTVMFGDGAFGRIPPNGAIVEATYRVGGGAVGNAIAGSIEVVIDAPQLALAGARVSNPNPATGGADREAIDHAVMHAPDVFRSLKRAVTAADYEALALDFPGVGKVRARATSWNHVTLFVAPQGGGTVSDVLEANLLAYFEDKRSLSTIIDIGDVDPVQVFITADVGVGSYYSNAQIAELVRLAAGSLLAFGNVSFEQVLYLSKVYEAIEAIAGVDFVVVTEFRRQDQPAGSVDPLGRIVMVENELAVPPADPLWSSGIRVTATGGF